MLQLSVQNLCSFLSGAPLNPGQFHTQVFVCGFNCFHSASGSSNSSCCALGSTQSTQPAREVQLLPGFVVPSIHKTDMLNFFIKDLQIFLLCKKNFCLQLDLSPCQQTGPHPVHQSLSKPARLPLSSGTHNLPVPQSD